MIQLILTIKENPTELRGATSSFAPFRENVTRAELNLLQARLEQLANSFRENATSLCAACEADLNEPPQLW